MRVGFAVGAVGVMAASVSAAGVFLYSVDPIPTGPGFGLGSTEPMGTGGDGPLGVSGSGPLEALEEIEVNNELLRILEPSDPMKRLRARIIKQVNEVLGGTPVRDALFTELLMQ